MKAKRVRPPLHETAYQYLKRLLGIVKTMLSHDVSDEQIVEVLSMEKKRNKVSSYYRLGKENAKKILDLFYLVGNKQYLTHYKITAGNPMGLLRSHPSNLSDHIAYLEKEKTTMVSGIDKSELYHIVRYDDYRNVVNIKH